MPSPVEKAIRGVVTKAVMKVAEFSREHRPADGPHPYLSGIHTPLTQEHTLTGLAVQGQIPPELDGCYVRNGPNPITPPNPGSYHWFLGTGMLHGVRLQAGQAQWYRNRWVRGQAVTDALGEPPTPGPRAPGFDAPNTNVIGLAGATWAIVEAGGFPVRLDAELNTVAHDAFGGTLKHAFSAHPHRDPATGELHAICYNSQVQDRVWHVVLTPDGRVRREEPIAVQHGPSIHDCMITARYVLVLDLPVTFSMKAMVAGHGFPYRWNPDHPARVGLLPRDAPGDAIVWCEVDPCYTFHPANAFDAEDGTVVMDACVHDTMFAGTHAGPSSKRVPLERWTIDPVARRVTRREIDAASQEFPRTNEAFTGQPYRYAYTAGLSARDGESELINGTGLLYKHDLSTSSRQVHDFGAQQVAGEFVFVPKAGATDEDDGWLMGYVVDTARDTTDLVILDAARFEAAPQARITLPLRIPPGFHGNWIPTA